MMPASTSFSPATQTAPRYSNGAKRETLLATVAFLVSRLHHWMADQVIQSIPSQIALYEIRLPQDAMHCARVGHLQLSSACKGRTTMPSTDSMIQDYIAALRVLDLEGASVLGSDVTIAYRRLILEEAHRRTRQAQRRPPRLGRGK